MNNNNNNNNNNILLLLLLSATSIGGPVKQRVVHGVPDGARHAPRGCSGGLALPAGSAAHARTPPPAAEGWGGQAGPALPL